MWRLAGDTATDYNHYSKRTILGTVYGSTVAVFLDDESEDSADTRAFLARRNEQVMRFKGWKHCRAPRRTARPSDRKSAVSGKSRQGGVALGGRSILKKNKQERKIKKTNKN